MGQNREVAIRTAQWELYVDAFIDVLQVVTQITTLAASRSMMWLLLVPHVASITLAFMVFQGGYSRRLAVWFQIAISLTLTGDGLLLLILSFSIADCVLGGKAELNSAVSWGSNLCTGTGYDLGLTEVTLIGLCIGSIMLQSRQLIAITRVVRGQDDASKVTQLVVIESILFLYAVVMTIAGKMYIALTVEVMALVFFMLWAWIAYKPASSYYAEGKPVALALFVALMLLQMGYALLDATWLCKALGDWHAKEYFACQTTGVINTSVLCAIVVVRLVMLAVLHESTHSNEKADKKTN